MFCIGEIHWNKDKNFKLSINNGQVFMRLSLILALLLLLVIHPINAQNSGNSQSGIDVSTVNLINVTIGGDFLVNGSFQALRTERLDQLITRVHAEAREVMLSTIKLVRLQTEFLNESEQYPLRNIKLIRFDGTETVLDIAKFRLTGDFSDNPYLRNDDVIIFPAYDPELNFIQIDGAVNNPTKFQFVEGDRLKDALFFAQGINPAYEDVKTAEITRLSYDGNSAEILYIPLSDSEFELNMGDRIKILAKESQRRDFKVLVLGEVERPGPIFVAKDSTTVKEVIRRSGGLTPSAWKEKAKLIRSATQTEKLWRKALSETDDFESIYSEFLDGYSFNQTITNLNFNKLSSGKFEDTVYINILSQLWTIQKEGMIDLTRLDDPEYSKATMFLQDGDVLIVPQKEEYVYVIGAVSGQGIYPYQTGMDYRYYIREAGGLSEFAKDIDDECYLIKGETMEWVLIEEDVAVNIEPGDFIFMPKQDTRNFNWYVTQIGNIAGIVGSVATLVILLTQLGN